MLPPSAILRQIVEDQKAEPGRRNEGSGAAASGEDDDDDEEDDGVCFSCSFASGSCSRGRIVTCPSTHEPRRQQDV